jgi:signal transduction histidine kinase
VGIAVDASPEQLCSLFDSVSVALCAVDGDGNILRTNPAAHKLLGWDPAVCQGQPLARYLQQVILDPTQLLAWTIALSEALSLGKTTYLNVPSRFRTQSGPDNVQTLSGVIMAAEPVDDTHPRVIVAIHEHDAAHSIEGLRARLFSPMTRELEPPMNHIALAADMLAATPGFQEGRQRRLVNIIQTEIARLQRLMAQFLADPPSPDQQRLVLRHVVTLPPLMHRIAQVFGLRGSDHTIVLQVQPHLPTVWGNADAIQQVLSNLVDNALKHAPPRSTVTLSAQAEPHTVRIGIVNEGPELAREDLERLFRPRPPSQEPNTENHRQGMGLSISIPLVKSMGGELAYEKLAGGKHFFFFTLPRTDSDRRPPDGGGG